MAPLAPAALPPDSRAAFRSSGCSLGPAPRGSGDKGPGPTKRGTEARRPRAAAHEPAAPPLGPPPPLRLPAPPGFARRAGGGGRASEGGRRGLQTDSSSRRRGAEPDSPLSARTRKRFPSDPPLRPRPRSPARRPPPRAHARGRPASLWRWGRAAAQRSFSRQRRPADAQAEPAGCATGAQSAFGDLPERLRGGGGAGRTPRTRPGSLRVRAPRPPPSGLRVPRPPFGSICLTQALYISNSKPLFRLYQNISPQRVIHSPRLIADGFSIKPFPATLHHPPSLNLPP